MAGNDTETQPQNRNIIWINDAHPRQLELIGFKAMNLAVAHKINVPVPPGFIITTAAYSQCLNQTGFSPGQFAAASIDEALQMGRTVQHYLMKQDIPSELLTDIRSAYKQLSGGKPMPVVVRPSVIYKNDVDFAKRLRPLLGVKSLIDLEKALKMAWAYMWLDDIIHYRFSKPELRQRWNDVALLIQPLMPIQVSGSALCYLPEKDEQSFLIEAAPGLNEAVSRGVVVPDRFIWQRFLKKASDIVPGNKHLRFAPAEQWAVQETAVEEKQRRKPCLSEFDVQQLGNIAEKLTTGYKRPVHFEWFKTEQHFFVLQMSPAKIQTPEQTRQENWEAPGDSFPYFERPLSPLGWSVLEPLLNSATLNLAQTLNFPENVLPEPRFHLQNHMLMVHSHLRQLFPQQLDHYWGEVADLSPFQRYTQFLRSLVPLQRQWNQVYQNFIHSLEHHWHSPSESQSAEQILEAFEDLQNLGSEFINCLLLNRCLHHLTLVMFTDFAQHYLPEDGVYDILFQGLDSRKNKSFQLLDHYLKEIQNDPERLKLFRQKSPHEIVRQLQLDTQGKAWLAQLMDRFQEVGFYRLGLELLYPSWIEAPQILVQELKNALIHPQRFWDSDLEFQREALENSLKEEFSWLQLRERFFFLSLLHLGQSYTVITEDEPYYLAMLFPHLRTLALTLARYLPLDSPQDIFYLTYTEIREMVLGQINAYKLKTLRELIQARKYKRRITHKLGSSESTGELKALEVKGYAASRGEILGKLRIVTRSEDLSRLQPGEIIVTDYFEVFWEEALQQAGGLIMELGGATSHGAILARHYDIPAVAGVSGALNTLETGLIARLDGSRGVVYAYREEILDAQEEFVL